MNAQSSSRGFTLIELLIVVAIIAILASIAVPNFLEAQTRSKVSRELSDLRSLATAMESYFVDNNTYPRDSDSSLDLQGVGPTAIDPNHPNFHMAANGALQLTTLIAYLSGLLSDPFVSKVEVAGAGAIGYRIGSGSWSYPIPPPTSTDLQGSPQVFQQVGPLPAYVLIGVGPDGNRCRMGYKCFPFMPVTAASEGPPSTSMNSKGQPFNYTDYDPTNGTVSVGDVYRFGGSFNEGRFMRNGAIIGLSEPKPGAPDAF